MANATGRPIAPLVLSPDERAYLERQVRRHRAARSLSERCRVILRCADGLPSKSVASELGFHEHTVGKWRRRFLKDRIEGLLDEARRGRPRTIDDDQVAAVIERTLRSTPKDATHWSIRSMATRPGFRIRRSGGFGTLSACSRIARRRSSFPMTRCSSTRSAASSVFICRRPIGHWC
jgi:transposase